MLKSKRRRLEAQGWKFGTIEEFLDLTPAEMAYIDMRIQLGDGLKALRKRKRLTQSALAERVGSSQSRVAKMETGNPTVSLDLLIRSLIALGASNRDIGKMFFLPRRRRAA